MNTVVDQRKVQYMRSDIDCYFFSLTADNKSAPSSVSPGAGGSDVIAGTLSGNIKRFFNHSCSPNCGTLVMLHGSLTVHAIFSEKDIPKRHELMYNYRMRMDHGSTIRAIAVFLVSVTLSIKL